MKAKSKTILFILISAAVILIMFLLFQTKKTGDPVRDFITQSNYPFNGYYNEHAKEYTEKELADLIAKHEYVTKYAENIELKILADKTIKINAELKDVSELINDASGLMLYENWANSLSGQTLSTAIELVPTNDNKTAIRLKEIKIGDQALDPKLFAPFIEKTRLQQQLANVSYSDIVIVDGKILLNSQLPMLIQ